MSRKYRTRVIEVEARKFDRAGTLQDAHNLASWCGGEFRYDKLSGNESKTYYWSLILPTYIGRQHIRPGDYVLKHENGEFSWMSNRAFLEKYEEITHEKGQ